MVSPQTSNNNNDDDDSDPVQPASETKIVIKEMKVDSFTIFKF